MSPRRMKRRSKTSLSTMSSKYIVNNSHVTFTVVLATQAFFILFAHAIIERDLFTAPNGTDCKNPYTFDSPRVPFLHLRVWVARMVYVPRIISMKGCIDDVLFPKLERIQVALVNALAFLVLRPTNYLTDILDDVITQRYSLTRKQALTPHTNVLDTCACVAMLPNGHVFIHTIGTRWKTLYSCARVHTPHRAITLVIFKILWWTIPGAGTIPVYTGCMPDHQSLILL